jgi:hypothetical protein
MAETRSGRFGATQLTGQGWAWSTFVFSELPIPMFHFVVFLYGTIAILIPLESTLDFLFNLVPSLLLVPPHSTHVHQHVHHRR